MTTPEASAASSRRIRLPGAGALGALLPLVAAITLVACTPAQTAVDGIEAAAREAAAGADAGDAPETADTEMTAVFDRITGCDDVAAHVAPFIEGLKLHEDSIVDEWGVYCTWESPEGITDLSQIASVEVMIEPTGTTELAADADDLERGGLLIIPDAAIERAGGVAYTMDVQTSVAAAATTSVDVPGVELTVTGGQWGDLPALDADAAIEVAKSLLSLG